MDLEAGPRGRLTVPAMSWFWNKIYGGTPVGGFYPPTSSPGGPGEGEGGGGQQQGPVPEEGKKWVGFDPTGLERAAKAAKELDQSRE